MSSTPTTLLVLVTDGVEYLECQALQEAFAKAEVKTLRISPQSRSYVETLQGYRRGPDLTVDLPVNAVEPSSYAGLVIPHGVLSTGLLRRDAQVLQLLVRFYQEGLPIFVSGDSVELLYDSHVLSRQVVIREGGSIEQFIRRSLAVLTTTQRSSLFPLAASQVYRPTI